MKKRFTLEGLVITGFLSNFITETSTYAQGISGKWSGVLKVQGTQLRLIFNIIQAEKGYISTMDSPDQGAKGIPVSSISYDNPIFKTLNFKCWYST